MIPSMLLHLVAADRVPADDGWIMVARVGRLGVLARGFVAEYGRCPPCLD